MAHLPPDPEQENRRWAAWSFDGADRRYEALIAAAIESANVALKGLLLLNGGAAIALLAFLANVLNGAEPGPDVAAMLARIGNTLTNFGWGAGAAVAASCVAYVTNRAYAWQMQSYSRNFTHPYLHETPETRRAHRIGVGANVLAVGCGIASLGFFLFGIWQLIAW